MDRYYKKNTSNSSRTDRNKTLYNSIYSYGKYSNIEGIASIDNTNEIDITKIKEMLDNREKYQVERKYRKLTNSEDVKELPVVHKKYNEDENKNYDIMDVLSKARESKMPDDKERVLSKTSYDVLKSLNLKSHFNADDYTDDDIKDMIQTISNTSMLNKMNDIKELIDETKKKEQTMDNSFFTSNIKLKKADFVGYKNNKSSVFKTILITIIILGIITVIGILVAKKLNLF